MVLPLSRRISRVPRYSGSLPVDSSFNYGTFTLFRSAFQPTSSTFVFLDVGPYPDSISQFGLGSYPFARHYLGNRSFTFFSSSYLDGSLHWVPFIILCVHIMIIAY